MSNPCLTTRRSFHDHLHFFDVFDCFGLFVNLEPYFISGLLHVSDLPDDRYLFLQDRNALKGKRRGTIFRLGQKIRVKIAAIFPLERKINLVISNGR